MSRNADLDNPSQVLQFIAKHEVSTATKECLCYAYRKYCQYYKIQKEIPSYKKPEKSIQLPKKEKLEILVTNASKNIRNQTTTKQRDRLTPYHTITSLLVK